MQDHGQPMEEEISRRGWFSVSNATEGRGRMETEEKPLDLTLGIAGTDTGKDRFGASRRQG